MENHEGRCGKEARRDALMQAGNALQEFSQ
jgi:hypothetical protein